jgi:hypothetical protein
VASSAAVAPDWPIAVKSFSSKAALSAAVSWYAVKVSKNKTGDGSELLIAE